MKTCPSCGSINLDGNLRCGLCRRDLQTVQSQTGEAARALALKLAEGRQLHAQPKGRATGLGVLGSGVGLLLGGIALLFLLANAFGVFLMLAGFLVIGAVTGLFQGAPYRGRGSRSLNRARLAEEARRRKREFENN